MFSYLTWAEYPINNRIKLANHYGVVKKSSTHVMGNKIVSDGYDMKEIEQMLLKVCAEFPTGDLILSMDACVNKIDGKEPVVVGVDFGHNSVPVASKKKGRPKKA